MEALAESQWPATVDEAVDLLLAAMPDSEREALAELAAAELPACRSGLGAWVRNAFGLWRGNARLLRSCAAECTRRERELLTRLPPADLDRMQQRYRRALESIHLSQAPSAVERMRTAWLQRAADAEPEALRTLLLAGTRAEEEGAALCVPADTASALIVMVAWERLRGATEGSVQLPWPVV